MSDQTITCPHCHTEIKLTESLAAPLIAATQQRYERELADKDRSMAEREADLAKQRAVLGEAKAAIEETVATKLKAERAAIAADESRKAKALLSADLEVRDAKLEELKALLSQRDLKLADAQKVQAEVMKKERGLDEARRELDITIEARVAALVEPIREKAAKDVAGVNQLKLMEKETQITSMKRQIEELQRKAEQGSQQLQGEVQELHLEALIRARFPGDLVEPVPKGEFGGDVLQRVCSPAGAVAGTILWESKRTKNWSDGWLTKLRDDVRAAKADVALIVSQSLPKGIDTFDFRDGVWVTSPKCAIPVALALRQSLLALSSAHQARDGQLTKAELVYDYLIGPRFRQRVEAIVEKFDEMQSDLDRERKAMTRGWAKRETQIQSMIDATTGLYGDLQGIAGKTMAEIDGLELPLLEGPDD